MACTRPQLTDKDIQSAFDELFVKANFRLKQKGYGSYASGHEILGIIEDELQEYRDEVHRKSSPEEKVQELLDIAYGAIFAIASIRTGGVDW